MMCPVHMEFFNDTKYLVSGAFETYDAIRYNGRLIRCCKACSKKIHEINEQKDKAQKVHRL